MNGILIDCKTHFKNFLNYETGFHLGLLLLIIVWLLFLFLFGEKYSKRNYLNIIVDKTQNIY